MNGTVRVSTGYRCTFSILPEAHKWNAPQVLREILGKEQDLVTTGPRFSMPFKRDL